VYHSQNVTVRGNTAYRNNLDNASKSTWRAELQTQAADNVKWIDNVAVADKTVNKYNTAIGNFSFSGDKNTGITWSDNTTYNGKSGDASVSVSSGNASPTGSGNDLGKNPGLSLSTVKSMAAKLAGATASASAASAAVESLTSEAAAAGTETGTETGANKIAGVAKVGTAASDKLEGGAGDDRLYAKDGADKVHGGAGDDFLSGGKGNDLVQGGTGKDVLVGAEGADDFVFKSVAEAGKGDQRDVIRDFSHAQGDDIDLSGIDANTKVAGNQAFAFVGDKAFSGKAGQIQYKNGIVAGDVNGDKVADFHIEIANHAALHADDFIL
jgi:hypothetical protein